MAEKTKYVDAEKLIASLRNIHINNGSSYSSSLLENHINQLIDNAIRVSLDTFKYQVIKAIEEASVPYDKCMLCVQRDSCIPDHPLGDNR